MDSSQSEKSGWQQSAVGKDSIRQKQTAEVENTLERVRTNSTVQELLSYDSNGIIIRSTLDTARAQIYRNTFKSLSYAARKTVKNMDPRDDLKFIRMRTQDTEIFIAPDNNGTLVVLQSVSPYEPPYRAPKKENQTSVAVPLKAALAGAVASSSEI